MDADVRPTPVRTRSGAAQRALATLPVRAGRRLAYQGFALMPVAEALQSMWQLDLRRRCEAFERSEADRLRALTPARAARVGVVMATFQRPERCRAAVESVLAQTESDLRLVVVDDGGGRLPALPADERVVAVSLSTHTGNLGLVRNVGLRLLLGHVSTVAFLDDDNRWRPEHLAEHLAHRARIGTDPLLTYSDVEVRDEDGQLLRVLAQPWSRAALRRRNFVDANSVVADAAPAQLFSRLHRANLSMRKEDWEYVLRWSRSRTVCRVPVRTVDYLQHAGSYLTDHAVEAVPPEPESSVPEGDGSSTWR